MTSEKGMSNELSRSRKSGQGVGVNGESGVIKRILNNKGKR